MQKIANYNCDLTANAFIKRHFKIDKIELESDTIFDHEILLWNNNSPLSDQQIRSFPKLKMLITWCVENKNITYEDELKKRKILIKKMDILLTTRYDKNTQEASKIKSDTLTFFLKKCFFDDFNTAYVIRHGETEWNKKDIFQGGLDSPLTKRGVNHAISIAKHLAEKEIKYVFSSPLGRSLKTAKIITDKLKAKLIVVPEFQEMHFGIFQGKKTKIIKKQFTEFFVIRQQIPNSKLFIPYPKGESYFDVYLRAIKPLMSLLANYDNFVIVGHESINRLLRGIMEELPLEQMIAPRQKNNQIIAIDLKTGKEKEVFV